MRKKPKLSHSEQKFIDNAISNDDSSGDIKSKHVLVDRDTSDDLHRYVTNSQWPIDNYSPNPSLDEGSNLKRSITLNTSEKEWNSIERHVKALDVPKAKWIRYAIMKLMEEEQLHYLKQNKK